MAGLKSGMHFAGRWQPINIYNGGEPSKTRSSNKNKEMDKLLLRLTVKDDLSDSELMQLTVDVLQFVGRTLDKGDVSMLRQFLGSENRPMFSPDMKEMITDKIKLDKALSV